MSTKPSFSDNHKKAFQNTACPSNKLVLNNEKKKDYVLKVKSD